MVKASRWKNLRNWGLKNDPAIIFFNATWWFKLNCRVEYFVKLFWRFVACFPHDFEGSRDSLVLTSRFVTNFEKGFIRGLENFQVHPLIHVVYIFLKRRIKSCISYPLCHDAHIFWKRRIKFYVFSSYLSWSNSDVMIPSVWKMFVCFIYGQIWNTHPTSVASCTTLYTISYKPMHPCTQPTYQSYKRTYTQHTYPTPAYLPYIPTLPLQTYKPRHAYPQNTRRSSPQPVNLCLAWLCTIKLLDFQKMKDTTTVRAVRG